MGTDSVKWPTVSAQVFRSFPVLSCKCDTEKRMAAVTFSRGVTLGVGKEVAEVTGDKKGKNEKRRKGEKVGNMLKASCHTGGNTNKKYYISKISF